MDGWATMGQREQQYLWSIPSSSPKVLCFLTNVLDLRFWQVTVVHINMNISRYLLCVLVTSTCVVSKVSISREFYWKKGGAKRTVQNLLFIWKVTLNVNDRRNWSKQCCLSRKTACSGVWKFVHEGFSPFVSTKAGRKRYLVETGEKVDASSLSSCCHCQTENVKTFLFKLSSIRLKKYKPTKKTQL